MVTIVDGAVVLLHIRHQVVDDILGEHITAKTHLGNTSLSRYCAQQLRRVAIGKHNNHLLCLAFSQQVIEDVVHPSHLVVHLFGIGGTADQIEHGVLLVTVAHITWRQIDDSLVRAT